MQILLTECKLMLSPHQGTKRGEHIASLADYQCLSPSRFIHAERNIGTRAYRIL